jgi:hypothetical protein
MQKQSRSCDEDVNVLVIGVQPCVTAAKELVYV